MGMDQGGSAMTGSIALTGTLTLRPITPELAAFLGPAIAGMEPWSQINFPASHLEAFLTAEDPALSRHAVFVGGVPAGAIAIRSPWLRGPYLQVLAILPDFQGQGFGAILLDWFEREASPNSRWLWLCHSGFNRRAGTFYARHGFETVTELRDLLIDGGDEVLMRKRINRKP
jgi:ribosomal protein S18 acetylase RimI-like enzyme